MTDRATSGGWDAVFWDVGGVILDLESVQRAHRAFVEELVERHGLDVSAYDAVETWRAAVGEHFRERDGTTFRAARDGYAKGVAAVLGESLHEPTWRPLFDDALRENVEPVPGAVETIHALADRDLHLGVVSDVDTDEGHRILEEFGVREAFDSVVTSEAVGRTKPDAAMFETAVERAGVEPTRSLMVGDRYAHDVAGASAVGLQTVAFGAEDGPAVDYRIESPEEVLEIVDGERDPV